MHEIINLQLWQKLFCEPELTYLVKVDRQETSQNFNDSIDGIYCAGTSPLEQQIKQIIQDDLELDMKLKNGQVVGGDAMLSSVTRLNNSTKSSIVSTNNNGTRLIQKTHSYDDLNKLGLNSNKFKIDFDTNLDKEYHYNHSHANSNNTNNNTNNTTNNNSNNEITNQKLNNASTNEDLNNLSFYLNTNGNGDPIPTRRCSEPNLILQDALNCASPKLVNSNILFNYPNNNNNIKSDDKNGSSEQPLQSEKINNSKCNIDTNLRNMPSQITNTNGSNNEGNQTGKFCCLKFKLVLIIDSMFDIK